MTLFLDLHKAVSQLAAESVSDRASELAREYPGVFVVAVGGFPTTLDPEGCGYVWCGSPVDQFRIRKEILLGLGLSATLTYMNRKEHGLPYLGDLCLRREHDWAYRWMTLSLVFIDFGLNVELAFARDNRFLISWPVSKSESHPRVFVATSDLKAWEKFTSHSEDLDFDSSTREAMRRAREVLGQILPTP